MAIDGVGILDSDLAYDVYNHIMELYHRGEPVESIRNMISKIHLTCYGMDYEIVTAAYTLAMWEIGELTAAQLKDIRNIAVKGANSQWNNVHTGAQEARQKVLDEFLRKIEQPNLKIKKRKKYKKLTSLFSSGEVLSIKVNNRYRCIIFNRFYQCGQDAYYSFVITTYNSDAMPTTENILFEKIPVTKRTNAGAYGIRTLDVHYKFIEKHNSDLLKSGIIHLDTKAENLGFSRQISGFDSLKDMEKEMDDILLGEKIELYVCCLF